MAVIRGEFIPLVVETLAGWHAVTGKEVKKLASEKPDMGAKKRRSPEALVHPALYQSF